MSGWSSFSKELSKDLSKSHRKHKHKKESEGGKSEVDERSAMSLMDPSRSGSMMSRKIADSEVAASYHLSNIIKYLEKRSEDGKPPASEKDIEEDLNLKFKIKTNTKLTKALKANMHIEYQEGLYSYRGCLDHVITDKNALLDALKSTRAIKGSELKGSYKGYDKDLKQFVADGIIGEFKPDEGRGSMYYYYDPEYLDKQESCEKFREFWKNARVEEIGPMRDRQLRELGRQPIGLEDPFESLNGEDVEVKKRKARQARNWHNKELMDEINAEQ